MKSFGRFAERAAAVVAHPAFFGFCAGLVVAWTIALPFIGLTNELWHLALNSPTTAITFLLVPLLHHQQRKAGAHLDARVKEIIRAVEGAKDPVEEEEKG